MKWWLCGLVLCALTVSLDAQTVQIRGVSRTRASGWVFVDNGWSQQTNLIQVRFSVAEDHNGKLPLEAFFFTEDGKLVRKFDEVPRVQARGATYQDLPTELKKGRTYEITFPIPPSIETGPLRWRTFVAKMGGGAAPAVASFPGSGVDLSKLDFSQESVRALTGDAPSGDAKSGEVQPTIKTIARYKNPRPAWVENKWQTGLTTLRVKVRLESGAGVGDLQARAYFYDSAGNEVLHYDAPPQVQMSSGDYATLPPVWENAKDYEIHFPVPDSVDRGKDRWRDAVIVFGNKSKVAALCYPDSSQSPQKFPFPEKRLLETR